MMSPPESVHVEHVATTFVGGFSGIPEPAVNIWPVPSTMKEIDSGTTSGPLNWIVIFCGAVEFGGQEAMKLDVVASQYVTFVTVAK
ncbi:MAG TPA: hypothetical protein VND83_05165 [Acidimicrobiales bacterium]|nr:hypothetical protein [Acidimicrobiales bacterium]